MSLWANDPSLDGDLGTLTRRIAMFKWLCLLVATAGLAGFLWMINDIRLDVKEVTANVNEQLGPIKKVTTSINGQLPSILANTEKAVRTVDKHLPQIIRQTEESVSTMAGVSGDVKQFKELFGDIFANNQNKELLKEVLSTLDLLEGLDATIGLKKDDTNELKTAKPAKHWARAARKEAPFLSLIGKSRGDVLQRLTTTGTGKPWYIKVGEKAPMLLLDWITGNKTPGKGS
jgi:ABC-type transporter Mla subunit MlaD